MDLDKLIEKLTKKKRAALDQIIAGLEELRSAAAGGAGGETSG